MRSCDWISPLPPDRTDIASYSRRVETALAGAVRLNLIGNEAASDHGQYWFCDTPPLFNIGNDARFHGATFLSALAMGGAIVAHDHIVQNLIVGSLEATHGDWRGRYRSLMHQAYGKAGHQAALEFLASNISLDEVSRDFSGIEVVTSNALFVITHNPLIAEDIGNRTGLCCFVLPLPIAVAAEKPLLRKSAGAPDVLVFGYIGANRNVGALLDIMKDAEAPAFRLTIAGVIGPDDLRQEVEEAIAAGYDVDYPGFLSDQELDDRIHKADLVVNVRSPSMGEVSGSQLRVFAAGGLSVVSSEAWYATLPDDSVFKVSPENAARELGTIIETIASSPEEHQDKRRAGYRFVADNHALDRYRDAFLRMLDDSPRAIQHGIGVRIAERTADFFDRAGVGPFADADRILDNTRALCGWSI